MRVTRSSTVSLFVVGALGLAGCGSSTPKTAASPSAPASTASAGTTSTPSTSAGAGGASLAGASFKVSSKDFTESILLGKITKYALEKAGAKVEDKTNIKGSANTREALKAGQVDMYWEYTGTAWIVYQKNTKPIPDSKQQYEAVKKADAAAGIAWLANAPLNNTYVFAIRKEKGDELGVKTLSDLSALAKSKPNEATFCVESEFAARDDGFPGLTKTYGIDVKKSNVKTVDTGVIYTQTDKGTCNFGEVFATDGRIPALGLTVLKDDKNFSPIYNAALTLKSSLLQKYPTIADVINPIAAKLDDATMASLNAKVDVDGDDADDVAKEWLKSAGLG